MNDNCQWDLQEVPVAAVYHQQWMNRKTFDEYREGWEEVEEEKNRLGRCLLNVR